jgi:hypothetical protein
MASCHILTDFLLTNHPTVCCIFLLSPKRASESFLQYSAGRTEMTNLQEAESFPRIEFAVGYYSYFSTFTGSEFSPLCSQGTRFVPARGCAFSDHVFPPRCFNLILILSCGIHLGGSEDSERITLRGIFVKYCLWIRNNKISSECTTVCYTCQTEL